MNHCRNGNFVDLSLNTATEHAENQTIIGLILGLRPANERRCYKVTTSLIGWAQT